jgi:hypothetical protein
MKKQQCKVVVFVFGATTGLTVQVFKDGDSEQVMQANIPWLENGDDSIFWPMEWLRKMLNAIKEWAGPGDVLVGAMPGADLVFIGDDNNPIGPARHYRCVDPNFWRDGLGDVQPLDLYLATGGAAVEFWQPFSQILFERVHRPELWHQSVNQIVSLADWMTYQMIYLYEVGTIFSYDATMAQSQGLFNEGVPRQDTREVYSRVLGEQICEALFSGVDDPLATDGQLVRAVSVSQGRTLFPVSHDSPYSRDVGFSCCPFVLWTGSWLGMAIRTDVKPSRKSFEAGFAFEGVGDSRAAVTNTGMYGPVWKALKDRGSYVSYEAAVSQVMPLFDDEVPTLSLDEMPDDPKEAALWVLSHSLTAGPEMAMAMAMFVKAVATKCVTDIRQAAKLLQMDEPTEVAITGGWAENKAFIKAIKQCGLKVLIPPLAANATHAGLAAKALVIMGDVKTLPEALGVLTGMN